VVNPKRAKPGSILKVPTSHGPKYVQVVRQDDFGMLVAGLGTEPEGTDKPLFIAYVNPASIPKDWEVVTDVSTDAKKLSIPPLFFGSSSAHWTVQAAEGESYIDGSQATIKELTDRGYVHKVLWLAKDIADALDGKPLIWPFAL
jgi:hypothetical protein